MFSIEHIRAMNDKATAEARGENLEPYIADKDGDIGVKSCPKLGNFSPRGWKLADTYFVDNSGFGSEDEPALTFGQFLSKVKEGYGYAIGEAGQFQVNIHEYKRI